MIGFMGITPKMLTLNIYPTSRHNDSSSSKKTTLFPLSKSSLHEIESILKQEPQNAVFSRGTDVWVSELRLPY